MYVKFVLITLVTSYQPGRRSLKSIKPNALILEIYQAANCTIGISFNEEFVIYF